MIAGGTQLGLRRWLRNPGPTSLALLMLSLGVGVTTCALSLFRAVLLRPLPFADSQRLVVLTSLHEEEGKRESWPVSFADFRDWRARSRSLAELAVYTNDLTLKITGREGPELIDGEMVSAGYFRLLGIAPVLGRDFLPDEDAAPGGGRVVVLADDFWQQRYHRNPRVLGTVLVLDEIPCVVVGIMPAGFKGLTDRAQVWLPVSMATTRQSFALDWRKYRWLSVIGRLRLGQTITSARQEMAEIATRLEREYPDSNRQVGIEVELLAASWLNTARPILLLLLSGAALVLLIAYGNVSGLWLAEVIARREEIGIRTALGANRRQLVLQFITESLALTLLGFALGVATAAFWIMALAPAATLGLRSFIHIRLDTFVIGTILATALLCGILFGGIPALLGTRSSSGLGKATRLAAADHGKVRLQNLLVTSEIAMTMVLLLAASLMARELRRLNHMELGFRADRLLTLRTTILGHEYTENERIWSMVPRAIDQLSAVPGVEVVALAGPAVPTDAWHGFHITLDRPDVSPQGSLLILRHHVSPGYFRTLRVPILRGRDFTLGDHDRALPVVVVSAALAGRGWPGEDALGKRLKLGEKDSPFPWLTVIGVVGDIKHEGRDSEERPGPDLYLPILQSVARTPPVLNLVVRCSVPEASVAPALIRAFRQAAPGLPIYDVKTMEERLANQLARKRFFTRLMVGSAALALLLAVVGVYSLIICVLRQRVREMGIRIALGATVSSLTSLVVGQGLRLALAGIALGVVSNLLLAGLTRGLVHDLGPPLDPAAIGGLSILLVVIVAVTSYIPTRRALLARSLTSLIRGVWADPDRR